MSLLYSAIPHSGKIFSKINRSRLLTKGFAVVIVILYSLGLLLPSTAAKDLRKTPVYHSEIYRNPSPLWTPKEFRNYPMVTPRPEEPPMPKSTLNGRRDFGQSDVPETTFKSLHERHIDYPNVRGETNEYVAKFPDYLNYDNDYPSRWLNSNDYAFLFAIYSVDPEDYDEAAFLQSNFS